MKLHSRPLWTVSSFTPSGVEWVTEVPTLTYRCPNTGCWNQSASSWPQSLLGVGSLHCKCVLLLPRGAFSLKLWLAVIIPEVWSESLVFHWFVHRFSPPVYHINAHQTNVCLFCLVLHGETASDSATKTGRCNTITASSCPWCSVHHLFSGNGCLLICIANSACVLFGAE